VPNVIAITGATGFIGRRFVDFLSARGSAAIRVLVRNRDTFAHTAFRGAVAQGDMTDPAAFARVLEDGCTWVNAAQLDLPSEAQQINVMASLLATCQKKRVKRIVHCSTAVVVGRSTASIVTENTGCQPGDHYEATKLAIEQFLLGNGADSLEIAVLRPTAVFGPRGRNLLKLADDLGRRPALLNYLKSCLNGDRRMNLVHVDNVVAALAYLVDATDGVAGETFIISDDESPINNYCDVERRLMSGLGIADYPVAPVRAPRWMLSAALRAVGRTNINPDRIYDCSKIMRRGLRKPVAFEQGLSDFLAWYRSRNAGDTIA
jgi:nucleoside-diphosphate-sugar epimerase